ncbi:ADP-ribosylation factor-like protein 15 [Anabarilius grahami]|uniref:ADP-ribosylation factor-like protein 15 n=1 Tax=Anabarilius grahami TaxID=495550 RepID=A0A3N0YKL9_ANAGA|nr:ADP-ribosylation factor-like protein 15 [Anabarilius grahami]
MAIETVYRFLMLLVGLPVWPVFWVCMSDVRKPGDVQSTALSVHISHQCHDDTLCDLPGADSIKKYWSRYYQGSQGVVFVLDSASSEEDLEVARTELHSALQHPQLCTLPFLILANHQDKPAARSVQENKPAVRSVQAVTLHSFNTRLILPIIILAITTTTSLPFAVYKS